MARDTEDVTLWNRLGLTPRRARAFCQWMDDEEPVGISSVFLAHLVREREDRVRQWFLCRTKELREENARLQVRLVELENLLEAATLHAVSEP